MLVWVSAPDIYLPKEFLPMAWRHTFTNNNRLVWRHSYAYNAKSYYPHNG